MKGEGGFHALSSVQAALSWLALAIAAAASAPPPISLAAQAPAAAAHHFPPSYGQIVTIRSSFGSIGSSGALQKPFAPDDSAAP